MMDRTLEHSAMNFWVSYVFNFHKKLHKFSQDFNIKESSTNVFLIVYESLHPYLQHIHRDKYKL